MLSEYQEYIHKSRYARYLPDQKRRETWEETVTRFCEFWKKRYDNLFPYDDVKTGIQNLHVMPSMRALMTAGKALERDEIAAYNCSYVTVDNPRVFDETLFILMNGVGLGFSVERQVISKMPEVAEEFNQSSTVIQVGDSKIGWASAYRELISLLYAGQIPTWDLSKLRPAGAPLKTFGGRSSGPKPLDDLFKFTVRLFKGAAGRRLNSVECHDLMCSIASSVIVGGVRRSALISFSNLSDERMRHAKSGQWWTDHPERALANNSVAYTEKPEIGIFMKEWQALYDSKSGERGLYNRKGASKKMEIAGRRDFKKFEESFGATNPCGEIFLRNMGLCNLSTIIIRGEDDLDELKNKVRLSTIIGTFQSTLTNFRYVRKTWHNNADEERLLGVSMTGIMDHPVLSGKMGMETMSEWLTELKQTAINTNKEWADKLGINQSVAITTVKPEGTTSELVGASSGIHPRFSRHYIRTVRNDKSDPLAKFMVDQGIPHEDDVMKPESTYVFSFPVKSPEHAVIADQMSAIDQLEHMVVFAESWAEHNTSITVYVREHEWLDVGAWVYKNFDRVNGVSFLPYSDHSYKQQPFQPITVDEYNDAVSKFPELDWSKYQVVEYEDNTTAVQSLSCTSGVCMVI
jgi:ribonucleoside-triphosphate reductase